MCGKKRRHVSEPLFDAVFVVVLFDLGPDVLQLKWQFVLYATETDVYY